MLALERYVSGKPMTEFVHQGSALRGLRVAGPQNHRWATALAREARSLVHGDRHGPRLETESAHPLHDGDDAWPFFRPDRTVLVRGRAKTVGRCGEVEL